MKKKKKERKKMCFFFCLKIVCHHKLILYDEQYCPLACRTINDGNSGICSSNGFCDSDFNNNKAQCLYFFQI